ncbi:DsbA family protein [archaeon]|jgi:protein-disulfide isomerase|nr:DsbA family protein [archaeon]MBT4397417.1 DsbA family protein [archaeon]MBT4440489.1 DsbA family protein [archaeon]
MNSKKWNYILLFAQLVVLVVMLFQINAVNNKIDDLSGMAVGGADVVVDAGAAIADEPTIVEVSVDDDPWTGGKNADVVIVEFSDFECSFCSRASTTIDQLLDEYGNDIKVVFRDFPLSFHANAHIASEAAECAHEQDMFWEMHDMIFANQDALDSDSLKGYADELGLDTDDFNECLDSGEMSAEVDADFADGASYGVQGTPAFFINGELISGAQPVENFRAIIDKHL